MAFKIFIERSWVWMFLVVGMSASTVWGWSYGSNRVQTSGEDSAACTGYGPGWVALSYKWNGPVVGYLFGEGFQFSDGSVQSSSDRMDIRDTVDKSKSFSQTSCCSDPRDIDRWPWGYSGGGFDGCAYAYGTSKFAIVGDYSSGSCANGPSVTGEICSHSDEGAWWHSERIFCTDQAADPMCSPAGVWAGSCDERCQQYGVCEILTVKSCGCQAYGNIGAAAAYGSGSAVPRNPLGYVPVGELMDMRYETKDRQYVMAKWNSGHLTSCIEWAFFPRSCVVDENASCPEEPGSCDGGDACGMASCKAMTMEIVPEGEGCDRENSSCP